MEDLVTLFQFLYSDKVRSNLKEKDFNKLVFMLTSILNPVDSDYSSDEES